MSPKSSSEVWRVVPSAPFFEVSSLGNVRRARDLHPILGTVTDGGRVTVKLYLSTDRFPDGRRRQHHRRFMVHRLVCEAFHGPPPSPRHVCMHLNDVPTDNRASNLRWGTQRENASQTSSRNPSPNATSARLLPPFPLAALQAHARAIESIRATYGISLAEARRLCADAVRDMAPPPVP